MAESIPLAADEAPMKWQYRIGLRFLLVMVLFAAMFLAWIAREARRAERRTVLVAELAGLGIAPVLEEPTGLYLLVEKLRPGSPRRLGEWIGRGWLERPTVFASRALDDERVPLAVERLRQLGTVRELHTGGSGLSERGVSRLRSGLPGVNVVPSAKPALHRYFNEQVSHEHFAAEGLALAALLGLVLLGTLIFLAWPLSKRPRRRPLRA